MNIKDSLHSKRGAALLFVVVIVGLLSLAVVEFQRRTHLETVSASNAVKSLQAHSLSRSGFAAAAMLLREDMSSSTTDDRNEDWFPGDDATSSMPIPVGSDVVTIRIEDQSGKLPLGAMLDATSGNMNKKHVVALERLFEKLAFEDKDPYDLAYALIDWIDADAHGEFEYNENFTVPNTLPEHIDELGRIEGFDTLSPEEMAKLARHLDTRVNPDINALTAPAIVLYAMNSAFTALDVAENLYADLPANSNLITTALPKTGEILPFTKKSTTFRVLITANVGGVTRKADCIIERSPTTTPPSVKLIDWTQY
jgi:type II secretory pathway component PulK